MKHIDNTYNGWTNWETWNFKLWIDNDQDLYNLVHFNVKAFNNKEYKIKWLEIVADEIVGDPKLCADLKKSDIKNIDFDEILEAILEDK